MKIYQGTRDKDGFTRVTVRTVDANGQVTGGPVLLEPRLDLRNHSPTGLEWGYGGSGPAQLALALCADALGDDQRALSVYQHYKWQHVLGWHREGWQVTDVQVQLDAKILGDVQP